MHPECKAVERTQQGIKEQGFFDIDVLVFLDLFLFGFDPADQVHFDFAVEQGLVIRKVFGADAEVLVIVETGVPAEKPVYKTGDLRANAFDDRRTPTMVRKLS